MRKIIVGLGLVTLLGCDPKSEDPKQTSPVIEDWQDQAMVDKYGTGICILKDKQEYKVQKSSFPRNYTFPEKLGISEYGNVHIGGYDENKQKLFVRIYGWPRNAQLPLQNSVRECPYREIFYLTNGEQCILPIGSNYIGVQLIGTTSDHVNIVIDGRRAIRQEDCTKK